MILMTQKETINLIIAIMLLFISYFIGSIPFGIIIGKKFCNIDIREHGSKNIGSTNAIRVLGKKVGFIVFFLDVFKGMAIILLVRILSSANLFYTAPILTDYMQVDYLLLGSAAIIGHSFPIYIGFKGGKAVATSLGVVLLISPLAGILCLVAFVITLYATGYVSLASTFATLTVLITVWILHFVGFDDTSFIKFLLWKTELITDIIISSIATLIIIKHRKNVIWITDHEYY